MIKYVLHFVAFSYILLVSYVLFQEQKEEEYVPKPLAQIEISDVEKILYLEEQGFRICLLADDERIDHNGAILGAQTILSIMDIGIVGPHCDYIIVKSHGSLDEERDDTNQLLSGKTKDLPPISNWITSQCRKEKNWKGGKIDEPVDNDYFYHEEEEILFVGTKFLSSYSTLGKVLKAINYHRKGERPKCKSLRCLSN